MEARPLDPPVLVLLGFLFLILTLEDLWMEDTYLVHWALLQLIITPRRAIGSMCMISAVKRGIAVDWDWEKEWHLLWTIQDLWWILPSSQLNLTPCWAGNDWLMYCRYCTWHVLPASRPTDRCSVLKLQKLLFLHSTGWFSGCLVLAGTTTLRVPMKKESLRWLMASVPLSSEQSWWEIICSSYISYYTIQYI